MKNWPFFFFLFMSFFLVTCTSDMTSDSDTFTGNDIAVKWKLNSNILGETEGHQAQFTLQNNSKKVLKDNWNLYFNMTPRNIEKMLSQEATVEWISGDFYKLSPLEGFKLAPGETLEIKYQGAFWMIKEVDSPAGVYFVFEDENGAELAPVIASDYTLEPFLTEEQTSRFTFDRAPVPTPQLIFEQNSKISNLDEADLLPVIPTPFAHEKLDGEVEIDANWQINYQDALSTEALLLAEQLSQVFEPQLSLNSGVAYGDNRINLEIAAINVNGAKTESYELIIDENGISIKGIDKAGVFYGVQSLMALVEPENYKEKVRELELPMLKIQDAPRFPYRGLHLDVGRNFQSKEAVLRVIDVMAMYKLNKLHLHLTDDEGWRLEIPSLPELTEVGAKRGHTLVEDEFLHPSYGSGPDVTKSPGSGFYTKADFIEIIKLAHSKHVDVIPELNMPGHARAAIKSMEARYRRFMEEGDQAAAEEYLLTDFEDQSEYSSAQVYNDNTVCVCKESVYRFYETVVDEVIGFYKEANVPLNTIHTGGDEVPAGAWEKSPICADLIARDENVERALNLQNYFFGKIVKILRERNLEAGGWEEIVMTKLPEGGWKPNAEYSDQKVLPYVWNNLWGNQDLGNKLANAGYPVVLCNVTNLYFDLAYNKDPKEPGLYWGGLVDTRKAYELIPEDGLKSTRFDAMEREFDQEGEFKDMERLKPSAVKNIVGIQGEMWSETLQRSDMLEYYLLPKMYGLAERAWAKAEWETTQDKDTRMESIDKDWNVFANTLGQKEFKRIDKIGGGYNYRIPMPGAVIKDGMLNANIAFPGFELRYTSDGSEPTADSPIYTKPVALSGLIKVKAFDTQGRSSRTAEVQSELVD